MPGSGTAALTGAGIGLLAAGAAWLHWRRFMVPITVAAGAAARVEHLDIGRMAASVANVGYPVVGLVAGPFVIRRLAALKISLVHDVYQGE